MGNPPSLLCTLGGWGAPLYAEWRGGGELSLPATRGGGGEPSLPVAWWGERHPSLLCAVGVGSPPATSRFGNQAKNYA